jgi:hypothetical protein
MCTVVTLKKVGGWQFASEQNFRRIWTRLTRQGRPTLRGSALLDLFERM